MKYSILMPYHCRAKQLSSTLRSFVRHGYHLRGDVEIIIAEDVKNIVDSTACGELTEILKTYRNIFSITWLPCGSLDSWNPSKHFNACARRAQGKYLIITNPECAHQTNILAGLDEEFNNHPDVYVVCACLSVKADNIEPSQLLQATGQWYQHSQHRNVLIHFCSVLSCDAYQRIGGFDERYSNGMCFDDDDFRNRIIREGIQIVTRDDLVVLHLEHHNSKPLNYLQLHQINKQYYDNVWGKNGFCAEKFIVRE